jgi:quercetin dioxygenase-like cupin family protein
MKLYQWQAIPVEQMSATISRQVIHSESMTIARLTLLKGAYVPLHSHVNEQISTLERGVMRFEIGGEEQYIRQGESLVIPPNVPHLAEVMEDTIAVDVFTPVRADWVSGDDAYLRG